MGVEHIIADPYEKSAFYIGKNYTLARTVESFQAKPDRTQPSWEQFLAAFCEQAEVSPVILLGKEWLLQIYTFCNNASWRVHVYRDCDGSDDYHLARQIWTQLGEE